MRGIVYLICDGEKFKIGVTTGKIEKRLRELQTGNPNELWVSHYYETETPFRLEQMLHTKFHTTNVKNEWFDLDAYSVVHFCEICETTQKIIDCMKNNPYIKRT